MSLSVNTALHMEKVSPKSNLFFALQSLFACLLVFFSLCLDCIYFDNQLSETSVTEISQQVLLLLMSFRFFTQRNKLAELNKACLLIAMMFAIFFIRELDYWLDYIIHGFWKYPALLIAGFGAYTYLNDPKGCRQQLHQLLSHRYAQIWIFGLVTLLIFSRVAGMGEFWRAVMGEQFIRIVKNIVEEGIELLSYYMLTLASFKMTATPKHRS